MSDSPYSDGMSEHDQLREAVVRINKLEELLECLVDEDECWFDHHGGCQAHGFLSLQPGEICPHTEAKQLLGRNSESR